MYERARLIDERRFRREDGDRIQVRMGGPEGDPVEVNACRIYFQGMDVRERGDRFDLGFRRKTGYVAGRALSPRRVGGAEVRWAKVPRFHLTVRLGKRKRGEPELLVFDCRVDQRRRDLWTFTVLAEG